METHHWLQNLGLKQTASGDLIETLDPAESRTRSRKAREKSIQPPPDEEDADDSSARQEVAA